MAEKGNGMSGTVWINYDGEGIARHVEWPWRLPVRGETVSIEGRVATVERVEFELFAAAEPMVTLHLSTARGKQR